MISAERCLRIPSVLDLIMLLKIHRGLRPLRILIPFILDHCLQDVNRLNEPCHTGPQYGLEFIYTALEGALWNKGSIKDMILVC